MLQNYDQSRNVTIETDRLCDLILTFTHPDDVLHSCALSVADKRAILTSWASDAHAVPNLPAMRQLDSGAIVSIDTVLGALRVLDADEAAAGTLAGQRGFGPAPSITFKSLWRRPPRRNGGNDEPPPCPAAALPPGVELELRRRQDEAW